MVSSIKPSLNWATPGLARDGLHSRRPTVELQTENGYSIVRLCDVDESVSSAGTKHCFVVRDPNGYELEVTVELSADAVAEANLRNRGSLAPESTFWINCAERHLADYLWEKGDYPTDARLVIDHLTIEYIDLARRWDCDAQTFPDQVISASRPAS